MSENNYPELDRKSAFYWPLLKKSFVVKRRIGLKFEAEIGVSSKYPEKHNFLRIERLEPASIFASDGLDSATVLKPFKNFQSILELSKSKGAHICNGSVCWSFDFDKGKYRALDEIYMYLSSEEMSEILLLVFEFVSEVSSRK